MDSKKSGMLPMHMDNNIQLDKGYNCCSLQDNKFQQGTESPTMIQLGSSYLKCKFGKLMKKFGK